MQNEIYSRKKYTTIAIYAFIVLAAAIIFSELVKNYQKFLDFFNLLKTVLSPVIIGFALAYFLNLLTNLFERKLFSHIPLLEKKIYVLKIYFNSLHLCTYNCNFCSLGCSFIPKTINSISKLIKDLPSYANTATNWLYETTDKLNIDRSIYTNITKKVNDFTMNLDNIFTSIIPRLGGIITSLLSSITTIIISIIISIYVLIEKDKFKAQIKMIFYSIFSVEKSNSFFNLASRMNDIMKKFIFAQGFVSLIVGISFFIVLNIMKVEYPGILATILGFTNMIPWIGPWLGTIPSAIIILFQSPIKALWFLIAVLVVQQVNGNLISPRIHGDSLGVSAFWIIFSILIGNALFGFVGMLLGIPVFVMIYTLIKEGVERKLKKKCLPTKSSFYTRFHIEENSSEKDNIN